MTLNPESEKHLLQIQAGQRGRNKGHEFELRVSKEINNLNFEKFDFCNLDKNKDIFYGEPGLLLLKFISATNFMNKKIESACAFSTGSIATAEKDFKREIFINSKLVKKSKSDIVIKIKPINGEEKYFGISTKQCSIKRPTNAQLYFSTAKGFSDLLNKNFQVQTIVAIYEKGMYMDYLLAQKKHIHGILPKAFLYRLLPQLH